MATCIEFVMSMAKLFGCLGGIGNNLISRTLMIITAYLKLLAKYVSKIANRRKM